MSSARRVAFPGSHLSLAFLLGLGAIGSLVVDASTDALFTGIVAVLLLMELILLALASGVFALYGRAGPLAVVDLVVATPIAAALLHVDSLDAGPATLTAIALVVVGWAGAGLAARRVRAHRLERIALAVAVAGGTVAFWWTLLAALIPASVLVVLVAPERAITPAADAPDAAADIARRSRRTRRPNAARVLASRNGAARAEVDPPVAGDEP